MLGASIEGSSGGDEAVVRDISEHPERAKRVEGHERPNKSVRPERRLYAPRPGAGSAMGAPVEGPSGGAEAVVRDSSEHPERAKRVEGHERANKSVRPERRLYAPRLSAGSAMGAPVEGSRGGDEAVVRDISEHPERAKRVEGHERTNKSVRPERRLYAPRPGAGSAMGAPVEGPSGGAEAVVRDSSEHPERAKRVEGHERPGWLVLRRLSEHFE